jgi:septal ring factor EnvC (AmiA/AmiB activator)
MRDEQFTKLFTYMEKRFKTIEAKLDEKASQSSLNRLMNTIDAFIKRLDDAEIEQVARDRQFERLLAWARKVSDKTGIPLENL